MTTHIYADFEITNEAHARSAAQYRANREQATFVLWCEIQPFAGDYRLEWAYAPVEDAAGLVGDLEVETIAPQ